MVTVVGFVQQQNPESEGQSSLRHFELRTSVYDPSNLPSKSTEFSVVCFFPNDRRWANTPVPNIGSCVSVTTKVMGHVVKKPCLALRILDISYLSLPSTSSPIKTSTQSSPSGLSTPTKRPNRWNQRVDSTTPKKIRSSASDEDPITPSGPSNSAPQAVEISLHSPATISGDFSPNIQSQETEVDLTEVQPLSLDGRPQRNRRPTAKVMD
jgi:hypothetical protein